MIFSRYPDTVLVKGMVRYPGRYAWHEGMKLADILAPDDLLIDTDSGYAELRRQSATAETILSFSPVGDTSRVKKIWSSFPAML